MPHNLTISLSSETLSAGPAEERATFGLLAITANDRLLTEGIDTQSRQLRYGPHVSGFPLAEWFAWNWWRIRWELGRPSAEKAACRWGFAHRMPTIGEGYAWPNITMFSDGIRSFLDSDPSGNPEAVLFRYFGSPVRQTVPAEELEDAIDGFVEDILVATRWAGTWRDQPSPPVGRIEGGTRKHGTGALSETRGATRMRPRRSRRTCNTTTSSRRGDARGRRVERGSRRYGVPWP